MMKMIIIGNGRRRRLMDCHRPPIRRFLSGYVSQPTNEVLESLADDWPSSRDPIGSAKACLSFQLNLQIKEQKLTRMNKQTVPCSMVKMKANIMTT